MNKYFISFVIDVNGRSTFGNTISPIKEEIDSKEKLDILQNEMKQVVEKELNVRVGSVVILNFQKL